MLRNKLRRWSVGTVLGQAHWFQVKPGCEELVEIVRLFKRLFGRTINDATIRRQCENASIKKFVVNARE